MLPSCKKVWFWIAPHHPTPHPICMNISQCSLTIVGGRSSHLRLYPSLGQSVSRLVNAREPEQRPCIKL